MMSPNEEPSQLMMMIAENVFEIDKEFLRNEVKSLKHAEKSKWFFSTLTKEQQEKFRAQWYQTMETMEMNINPMFTYFDIYAANNQINYPFAKINMFQKEWIPNTTSKRKVVSTHPPLEEIKIKAQGVEIIASPFKTINEDETRSIKLRDIKGIQQQNNFTNQILGTISSQLNRIEKNIPNNTSKIKEVEKEKVKMENPLFKPAKPLKLGGNKNNDDLVKKLSQKLAYMELKDPSSSKDQINFLSGSEIGSFVSEKFTKNLKNSEQEIKQINKLKTWHKISKNFYQRPTPLDLQFEERQQKQNSYNNCDIYSWNIDGLSEHEILVVLRKMQMAATAYLTEGDVYNVV